MTGSDIFQYFLFFILAVTVFFTLATGQNGLRIGFLVFIAFLGIGYRQVYLTSNLTLHPAELLIWGLFLLLLLQRNRFDPEKRSLWFPTWLKLMIPFWLLAVINGYATSQPIDEIVEEAKNFLILIPLFAVGQTVLADRDNWRPVILVFFLTGIWIAFMGLLEYILPGLTSRIPGFMASAQFYVSPEGFRRALFSFYGSPVAVFTLVLSIFLGSALWEWYPARRTRLLIIAGALVQFAGIYISGYRSIWLVTILALGIWALVRFGIFFGAFSLAVVLPVAAILVPLVAEERFLSLVAAIEGNPLGTDSSSIGRIARSEGAIAQTLQRPIGSGWASSGWVHNDLLQISAGQGLLAAILYAGAWLLQGLKLLSRIVSLRRMQQSTFLPEGLLIALLASGGVMFTQGVTWLAHLALPVWLVWMLAAVWLHQFEAVFSESIEIDEQKRVEVWEKPIPQ
jgi:hypothetical protein